MKYNSRLKKQKNPLQEQENSFKKSNRMLFEISKILEFIFSIFYKFQQREGFVRKQKLFSNKKDMLTLQLILFN
jgi:hypothetical protein